MTPLNLLRTAARQAVTPLPTIPPTVTRRSTAAAAVARAKRMAEAVTPVEWLEASVDWCEAKGCHNVVADHSGGRPPCSIDCTARRKAGR